MSTTDTDHLYDEILSARERVYAVGEPTPLQQLNLSNVEAKVWVKREDLGPIKAYKWRGSYNAIAALTVDQRQKGIVAASAGNHAQGVALASKSLGCMAVIFMPRSTPEVKQREVLRFGGEWVEIRLVGDTYDEASHAAKLFCEESDAVYVHPYDDVMVMAGQGTMADEVVKESEEPFDRAYIAIGGGGLVAATACYLKKCWPGIKVYGVEGVEQASMKAALTAGEPVHLDYVDVFCDGTAVRKAGSNTFTLCNEYLDGVVTVTNDEVCHAIRSLWESIRVIPEPSGGMSLAGFLKHANAGDVASGEKVLTVVSGANMDFAQLGVIAKRAGIGSKKRRYLRVPIPEEKGSLVDFLKALPTNISIIDLQYGRIDSEVQYPTIGLIGSADDYSELDKVLAARGVQSQDVSKSEHADYRIIHYSPELFTHPLFLNIEFPERAGAFLQFMSEIKDRASICYLNYAYSGERVGRALIGIEFSSIEERASCLAEIDQMPSNERGGIRAVREVSDEIYYRLTGLNRS